MVNGKNSEILSHITLKDRHVSMSRLSCNWEITSGGAICHKNNSIGSQLVTAIGNCNMDMYKTEL